MKYKCVAIALLSFLGMFNLASAQKFVYEYSFGKEGTDDGEFDGIKDIAIHQSQDKLYILDNPAVGDDRIHLFTKSGTFIKTIEYSNKKNHGNQNLESIVIGPDGYVYVNDKMNFDVLKYNENLEFERFVLREKDHQFFELSSNHGNLAIDNHGNFYFHIFFEDGFIKYNKNGEYQGKVIDKKYNSSNVPIYIDMATNNIYTVSSSSGGVIVCDNQGNVIQTIGSEGMDGNEFASPEGITFTDKKEIIVLERDGTSKKDRIQHFGSDGAFIGFIGGTGNGKFKNPADIGFDPVTKKLFVSDGGNFRIQVFNRSSASKNRMKNGILQYNVKLTFDPCTKKVYINSKSPIMHISVMNICGRIIKRKEGRDIKTFDIPYIAPGMYFFSVRDGKREIMKKFVLD